MKGNVDPKKSWYISHQTSWVPEKIGKWEQNHEVRMIDCKINSLTLFLLKLLCGLHQNNYNWCKIWFGWVHINYTIIHISSSACQSSFVVTMQKDNASKKAENSNPFRSSELPGFFQFCKLSNLSSSTISTNLFQLVLIISYSCANISL